MSIQSSSRNRLWPTLYEAVQNGQSRHVTAQIAAGADVNDRYFNGRTPLHEAVRTGHRKAIQALIDAGANVNAKDKSERTPLHEALQMGRNRLYLMLRAAGADVDDTIRTGTGLFVVRDEAKKLRARSAAKSGSRQKKKRGDVSGNLRKALKNGRREQIEALVVYAGADANTVFEDGETPLHCSVRYGNHAAVKVLIKAGADVNIRNSNGDTPLQEALKYARNKIYLTLRNAGADLHAIRSKWDEVGTLG